MARGRGSRPTHYIAVTAKVGKGKYEKGPYIGLWEGEGRNDPLYRGSVSGKYADELFDFIKEFGEDTISFAVFESRGDRGNRRNRDEDNEDQPPRGRRSSRGSSRDERDNDRGGRGRSRDSRDDDRGEKEDRGSSRGKGGSRGGKGDWWED